MRKRIKFTKEGKLKFVGHLDLLRVFQRAFQRAEIQLEFSQGFNPHPLMSFANPLSVGITSEGEYMDINLENNISNTILVSKLDETLPDEIHILCSTDLKDKDTKAMATVAAANYLINHTLKLGYDELSSKINNFLNQKEIIVKKKSKKGIKDVDIKNGIYSLNIIDEKTLETILATGSSNNVKPQLLMEAFYAYIGKNYIDCKIQYHRKELFALKNNQFVPLNNV